MLMHLALHVRPTTHPDSGLLFLGAAIVLLGVFSGKKKKGGRR